MVEQLSNRLEFLKRVSRGLLHSELAAVVEKAFDKFIVVMNIQQEALEAYALSRGFRRHPKLDNAGWYRLVETMAAQGESTPLQQLALGATKRTNHAQAVYQAAEEIFAMRGGFAELERLAEQRPNAARITGHRPRLP